MMAAAAPMAAGAATAPALQPTMVPQVGYVQMRRPAQVIHHTITPRALQGATSMQLPMQTQVQQPTGPVPQPYPVVRQLPRPSSYTALPPSTAGAGGGDAMPTTPSATSSATRLFANPSPQTAPAGANVGATGSFVLSPPQPQVVSYTIAAAVTPTLAPAPAPAAAMHAALAAPGVAFGTPETAPRSPLVDSPSQPSVDGHFSRDLHDEGEDSDLDWILWTPADVAAWAEELLGPGCGEPFRRHKIDGPTLLGLSEAELREPLGFRDPLQIAKLLGHFRAFQMRHERISKKRAQRRHVPPNSVPPRMPTGGAAAADFDAPRSRVAGASASAAAEQRKKKPSAAGDSMQRLGLPPSLGTRGAGAGAHHDGLAGGSLSRSPSATSSQGHFSASSRYSRHLAASKSAEAVNSCFGVDTPSQSNLGSFPQAERLQHRGAGNESPGPAAYDSLMSEHSQSRHVYKATMGTSPRRTSPAERSIGSNADLSLPQPGPQSYNAVGAEAALKHTPRAVFGSSPRDSSWHAPHLAEALRRGPGPGSYNCETNKTRTSSPHATMGKAARDTCQYIATQEPAACAATSSRRGASADMPSPRIRGGVIGTSARSPKPTESDKPGPCYYDVARAEYEKSAHQPSARIGQSHRDTCEYLVRNSPRGGRSANAAVRVRSGDDGPGPMSYNPKPTALSTFR